MGLLDTGYAGAAKKKKKAAPAKTSVKAEVAKKVKQALMPPKKAAPKKAEVTGGTRIKASESGIAQRAKARKVAGRSRVAAMRQARAGGVTTPRAAVKPAAPPTVKGPGFKMHAPPSATERARQAHAGRGAFHAEKAKRVVKAAPAPAAPKGPGLGARVGQRLRGARAPRLGSEAFLKGGQTFIGRAARRVAPGAGAGVALGAAAGGRRGAAVGGAVGAGISAIAPRLITRTVLPVAAAAGAVDIGRAVYHGARAVGAAKHVKRHARAAKKAGYRVTRRHPLWGAITGEPGIRIQKVEDKKRRR